MKIPEDAFDFYVSLGPGRSYQAVAKNYGVAKRSVVRHAKARRWTERLSDVQAKARKVAEQKLIDSLEEMQGRHLKLLRAMSMRTATALRDYPLRTGIEAFRAAELVIKLERLVHGEPSEKASLSVEEISRQEIRELVEDED